MARPQREKLPNEKLQAMQSIPFFLMHVAGLAAPILYRPTWPLVLLCIGSYYFRMFGVTGGYHRYFSHKTFKTSRAFQFFLAFLAETSAQKGVLWWAANHRHHHAKSDRPDDIHSPVQRGFWWSHVGWILCDRYAETQWKRIGDFAKYPELRWLNEYNLIPPTIYAAAFYFLFGMEGLFWGFFLSTILLFHGTFTINSLSHVFGSQRYRTGDTSRNNGVLAAITLGEGWHNNHHHYQASARNGFAWWEIDVTYIVLKALSWVGLVRDLRNVPEKARRSNLLFEPPEAKANPMGLESMRQKMNEWFEEAEEMADKARELVTHHKNEAARMLGQEIPAEVDALVGRASRLADEMLADAEAAMEKARALMAEMGEAVGGSEEPSTQADS